MHKLVNIAIALLTALRSARSSARGGLIRVTLLTTPEDN